MSNNGQIANEVPLTPQEFLGTLKKLMAVNRAIADGFEDGVKSAEAKEPIPDSWKAQVSGLMTYLGRMERDAARLRSQLDRFLKATLEGHEAMPAGEAYNRDYVVSTTVRLYLMG